MEEITVELEDGKFAAHVRIYVGKKLVSTVSAVIEEKPGYDGGGTPCIVLTERKENG